MSVIKEKMKPCEQWNILKIITSVLDVLSFNQALAHLSPFKNLRRI